MRVASSSSAREAPRPRAPGHDVTGPHEVANVGQEVFDHPDLIGPPAARFGGAGDDPGDDRAVRAVQAHVQAVQAAGVAQPVVIDRGGLLFLLGIEVREANQFAVREALDAGHAFVDGVVGVEVASLQVVPALAAPVSTRRQDPGPAAGVVRDHEGTAGQVAGFVDQGQGGGPQGVVQRRVVQGLQQAGQNLAPVHDDTSLPIAGAGPSCLRLPALRSPASHAALEHGRI